MTTLLRPSHPSPQFSPGITRADTTRLPFVPVNEACLPQLATYLAMTDSRTCDYTLGGVILWTRLFHYSICAAGPLMLLRGRLENDRRLTAFSLPLGCRADLVPRAVELLREFNQPLRFSAIPEDRLHLFAEIGHCRVEELGPDWSDYLYSIEALATLAGRDLKRKRNHVNRFLTDHPHALFEPLSEANAPECAALLRTLGHDNTDTGRSEYAAALRLLRQWPLMSRWFTGRVLRADSDTVVAFTVGEVKADTLHVHIEKIAHTVSGAGETVCNLFCKEMLAEHPGLLYVNRQDDAGNPGLRAAKLSWQPRSIMPKFNVIY